MKGQGAMLFLLGMAVGIGCGVGGSYLMQQMEKADETPTAVTAETDKTTNKNKTDEASEPTSDEATEDKATEGNAKGKEQPTGGPSINALFSGYEWPEAEINGSIPQPNFGSKPTSVSTSSGRVQVCYKNVSTDDALAYVEELKNSGYTYEQHEIKTDDRYIYDARNGDDALTAAAIYVSYTDTQKFEISWMGPVQ